jgi:hypothetical protein
VETVSITDVPRFDELFPLYQKEYEVLGIKTKKISGTLTF